jgi:hypothetical protein
MSHIVYKQGNQVDSWLLVVGSQIANLTPGLSFGHNLCSRCPNGWCKPISDIYASIVFQWYKKLFKQMDFDPCNRALKIQKSIWESNSQDGSSFGSVRVHSLTLFGTPGSMWNDSQVFLHMMGCALASLLIHIGDVPHVHPWSCFIPKCDLCIWPQNRQATPKKCHS